MPARIFDREIRLFAQQRRKSGRCGPLFMCRPPEPPQPSDGGRRHLQVCPFRARVPSRSEQFVAAGFLPIGLVNEKVTFQIRLVAGPEVQRIGGEGAGVRDGYAHERSFGIVSGKPLRRPTTSSLFDTIAASSFSNAGRHHFSSAVIEITPPSDAIQWATADKGMCARSFGVIGGPTSIAT
jgi:hypothetical protein